jgi:hippurate hydrolase
MQKESICDDVAPGDRNKQHHVTDKDLSMKVDDFPPHLLAQMRDWRRDLHRRPEFGFEEFGTAKFVADKLRSFGLDEVVEGVGGTGVVGTLIRGSGNRSIALRAELDALLITERSGRDYASELPGVMHACGHDGHTAMLLGAAAMLCEVGGFEGTVRFIFQPAEEWGKGASAMLSDGLMERFPFEEIHGLHNMPGIQVGHFQTRAGPIMAAEDNFEIVLTGVGGHAARPHTGRETLIGACALVTALQTIVSRRVDPADIAVVSVTQLLSDGTRNVLAGEARILGDARSFRPEVSELIERHMRTTAEGVALGHGLSVSVEYSRDFVPVLNDDVLTIEALVAARAALGDFRVSQAVAPMTASEDFARFLQLVPGTFSFLGNGTDSMPLHNPAYDFNDDALAAGACYHMEMVRRRLYC